MEPACSSTPQWSYFAYNAAPSTPIQVLSQHAKALAQAHMKLTSAKEEADVQLEKTALKEERLKEELQMKQAMYIAEVNARLQDRQVMVSMLNRVQSSNGADASLVDDLRDLLKRSAETGMMDEEIERNQSSPGGIFGRSRGRIFGKLFD